MAREIARKRNMVDFGPEMRTKVEEDRLSSLPDEIIHNILSFVDIKFAVQTCVLSSRWKLIWTSLPHLNCASHEFRILPKFSKFVNRVLSRRNTYTEVSTVDLDFTGRLGQKFVEKIAYYAFSHNVQKLKITFDTPKRGESGDQLPPCLFGSESLKQLSLRTDYWLYDAFPCAQSPWNFPALTTLDLKNIWFCFDNTNNLDLFSKCVNLKNLTLDGCRARSSGVMQIFCPQLVNFTLKDGGWISKFSLLTPNLSSFYYTGRNELSLSSNGLRCLDTVSLEMSISNPASEEYRQSDANRLFSMFEELRNAKNLRVHVHIIEFLSTVPDILEQQPSPFSNLKCLKIKYIQTRKSTNSAAIDHVIKYLGNGSLSGNVIMELPETLYFFDFGWMKTQRRNWQELCKLVEMQPSKEITDPHIRQASEDVKKKLAAQCQELGLPPPCWKN